MTSSSQRVRVKTHPPLTSFQAWLILDPNQSINHFKASILDLLPNSNPSSSRYSHSQIQLESQGFAFLDQCQCSVIDVNDVIDVKLIPEPKERKSKKRPRTSHSIPPSPSTNLNPISKPQPEIPSETRVVKPLPTSTIPSKKNLKPVKPNVTNPIKPVVPGTGSSRTKARNLRKRKRKSLLRQQEHIKPSDEKCLKEGRSLSTDQNGNIQKVSGILKDPQVQLTTKKSTSSSSESSTESSESDSGSDSASNSKSASSSDTDSDSDSNSQSSAPSSAPIKPPHLNPTPSTSTSKPNQSIQQKIVPIIQNESFKMLSLSNKNKRKNLRQCSGNPNQSSKIIFCTNNQEEEEEIRLRNSSPKYTPASPTFKNPEIFNNEEEEIGLEKNEFKVGHGPPPSLRSVSTIPKNIKITWIDVEDPNWYAGQINHLSSHDQENLRTNTENCTTSKRKRAQNRKKQVKKNKRAKAAKLRNESLEQLEEDEEEEEGLDDEIEDEYNEFIKCGGHSIKPKDEGFIEEIETEEKVIEEWDKYSKVEVEKTKIGDRIAIKVIELSMETLTPELIIYYGTLLKTNHISFTIKIDPNCLPKLHSFLNQDFTAEEGEREEDEGYSALRERELIKESYRDSVMEGIWNGNENENEEGDKDCRDWNWAEVAELRRI